jgi:uncharacterized Rmd1/YagE family protein
MLYVNAYQIADSIDIKSFKAAFKAQLHYSDSDELFFIPDDEKYIYVFKYGVVCFLNYDAIEITGFLQVITPYCKNFLGKSLNEEFQIKAGARETKIGYNRIEIVEPEIEVLRLIMLNVSQSVALDYYHELTTKLMEETNFHTQNLEKKGRLNISGRNLKRYIGKTLNLKNSVIENLYIFDSPPETWEDEKLNKIDIDLKRTFDLQERTRNISEGLGIVKENLDLFKDLLQYRHSSFLEWIVIALIFVEVVNLFIEKFFNHE